MSYFTIKIVFRREAACDTDSESDGKNRFHMIDSHTKSRLIAHMLVASENEHHDDHTDTLYSTIAYFSNSDFTNFSLHSSTLCIYRMYFMAEEFQETTYTERHSLSL